MPTTIILVSQDNETLTLVSFENMDQIAPYSYKTILDAVIRVRMWDNPGFVAAELDERTGWISRRAVQI